MFFSILAFIGALISLVLCVRECVVRFKAILENR
jgi:hypothetical protein